MALLDRSAPLTAASIEVQESIADRFETETDPSGNKWEPWAASYVPEAESYPNIGILRRSGALYDAATSTEATVVTADSVFYKTVLLPSYGLAHEEGIPDRKTPLPEREFLGMSEESRTVIFAAFSEWFDRSIDLFVTARGRVGRRHSIRGMVPGMRGMPFISRASVGKAPLPR